MLNTVKSDIQYDTGEVVASCEPKQPTILIEAHLYLDFKYGGGSVDITFPDGAIVKLVVGNIGQIYFQVPSEG
jgi:hypothetical protein